MGTPPSAWEPNGSPKTTPGPKVPGHRHGDVRRGARLQWVATTHAIHAKGNSRGSVVLLDFMCFCVCVDKNAFLADNSYWSRCQVVAHCLRWASLGDLSQTFKRIHKPCERCNITISPQRGGPLRHLEAHRILNYLIIFIEYRNNLMWTAVFSIPPPGVLKVYSGKHDLSSQTADGLDAQNCCRFTIQRFVFSS